MERWMERSINPSTIRISWIVLPPFVGWMARSGRNWICCNLTSTVIVFRTIYTQAWRTSGDSRYNSIMEKIQSQADVQPIYLPHDSAKQTKKRKIDEKNSFIMAALYVIFLPCGFFLLSSFFFYLFSSPNLSGRRLDVYRTSIHGVALVRI